LKSRSPFNVPSRRRRRGAEGREVERDVGLAGLGRAVHDDAALLGLDPAALRRGVHVERLEGDDGVAGIDGERRGLGGDAGGGSGEGGGDEGLAHEVSCSCC
jgi:hypothetical protein